MRVGKGQCGEGYPSYVLVEKRVSLLGTFITYLPTMPIQAIEGTEVMSVNERLNCGC